MLDEETPLMELMNITETGAEEAARHPRVVIEDAIALLGNAIEQTSKIRRKRY